MNAGIPLAATDFFAELEGNNERDWWMTHKKQWEQQVRDPLQRLVDDLAAEFGPAKLFRPYRDVRFSLDKSPYKTHQGAVVATAPGVGYYVQISASGLLTGSGWYQPSPEQVAAYRGAVLSERSGASLARIVAAVEGAGFEVDGDLLKTAPRGIDPGHPRIALLRHRSLLVSRDHGAPDWLETDAALDQVREDWRANRPLMDWLAEHL